VALTLIRSISTVQIVWESFYVQSTLNGTRCAVSFVSLDRLLCLGGDARQQWWAAMPITARGFGTRVTVCDESLLDWDNKAKSYYPG